MGKGKNRKSGRKGQLGKHHPENISQQKLLAAQTRVLEAQQKLLDKKFEIEKLKERRSTRKYSLIALSGLILLIIIIFLFYGPEERVELISKFFENLGINKFFKIVLSIIFALAGAIFGTAKLLEKFASNHDVEV